MPLWHPVPEEEWAPAAVGFSAVGGGGSVNETNKNKMSIVNVFTKTKQASPFLQVPFEKNKEQGPRQLPTLLIGVLMRDPQDAERNQRQAEKKSFLVTLGAQYLFCLK